MIPEGEVRPFAGYKVWNQSTLGVTRYIIGHSLKVQLDLSFNKMVEPVSHDYDRLGGKAAAGTRSVADAWRARWGRS